MKLNTFLLVSLHLLASIVPFLAGLAFQSSIVAGSFGLVMSALFMTGLLARDLRIEDECEWMREAIVAPPTDPDEAITLPQIQIPSFEEPSTGVKHKAVDVDVPNVVTWHGQRGKS